MTMFPKIEWSLRMSREPTEEMLKAGKEAYDRKLADMASPYLTEEPGIGPLGYAYIAMFDADPDRCDAARLASHCQSLIDIIDDIQMRCDEPVDEEDMVMVRHIEADALSALAAAPSAPDGCHPDDLAVDRFAAAMKAKLAKKRSEGRGGWDGPTCSAEILSRLLREHVEKGDPLDVGNLAMMLHQRGERIEEIGLAESASVSQLHAIVDAWEALPGGRQVRNSDVEAWLAKDMAPAINAIRVFLRRPLPAPPALGGSHE